jgi:anti-sigma B factor antagonist
MDGQRHPGAVPAGTVVVMMPEELDHTSAGQVNQQLAAAFDGGATTVIADFTSTVFCDSSGIRELVLARNRALAGGAVFRAVIPDNRLLTYLTRTGVAGYLLIYPSLAHALATGPDQAVPGVAQELWAWGSCGGTVITGARGRPRARPPACHQGRRRAGSRPLGRVRRRCPAVP